MKDLLKIAGNVMDNFNPETDSANDFENLPDGQYVGLIEEVKSRKNEKGTEWISLKVSVEHDEEEDKYKGRLIFVSFFFTEKQVERQIKTITKMVHDLGFEALPLTAWEDLDTLAENLQALVGTEVQIDQQTSKSGYTNHTVSSTEE